LAFSFQSFLSREGGFGIVKVLIVLGFGLDAEIFYGTPLTLYLMYLLSDTPWDRGQLV